MGSISVKEINLFEHLHVLLLLLFFFFLQKKDFFITDKYLFVTPKSV